MQNTEKYVVTVRGLNLIRERLRVLKEEERPQNVRDLEEALAHGDLSENAEFHAAKERQSWIEGEVRVIEDKLSRVQVVDTSKLSGDRVVFGATVTVMNIDTDEEATYQIVGEDEADIKKGLLSYKAPIARALIGQEEGDEVMFQAPSGERTFEIVEVQFS